jgi:transcriptional regulator with GAF, ATPase, and Fis domain
VRELQNIIERAVITSHDGRLNLDRALPDSPVPLAATVASDGPTAKRVRTAKELEEFERNNIIAALDSTDWKVAGDNGAAQLLGIKPTTLSSRMKALGIKRKH